MKAEDQTGISTSVKNLRAGFSGEKSYVKYVSFNEFLAF